MEKKIEKLTKEEEKNQILFHVARELELYCRQLNREFMLCRNEALRAIERAAETGEMFFRINEEKMDSQTFLLVLFKLTKFEFPSAFFLDLEKRVSALIESIEIVTDFLSKIPGGRIPEAPKSYQETKEKIKYCY
jgi:hypothetical protein